MAQADQIHLLVQLQRHRAAAAAVVKLTLAA
jgi:hypothetical protein